MHTSVFARGGVCAGEVVEDGVFEGSADRGVDPDDDLSLLMLGVNRPIAPASS